MATYPEQTYLTPEEYIIVEQFHRQENSWILTEFQSLEDILPLISIQCDLPLHEIYDRVISPN